MIRLKPVHKEHDLETLGANHPLTSMKLVAHSAQNANKMEYLYEFMLVASSSVLRSWSRQCSKPLIPEVNVSFSRSLPITSCAMYLHIPLDLTLCAKNSTAQLGTRAMRLDTAAASCLPNWNAFATAVA